MYRIVVADSRKPRDGAFVENLGHYHPMDEPSTIVLDAERARMWLDRGAQPSDRVAKLLAIQGIAELPAKLKTRIALGEQRKKDAAKAKPQAEEAPGAEAAAAEAPAAAETAKPEAKAKDEAPAAKETAKPEAKDEKPAEPAPAKEEKPAE